MTVFKKILATLSFVGLVTAQSGSQFCDSQSGICFQGYTDPELDVTVGFVLPPLTTPPSNELIIQMVAPVANGYTGISLAGTMADSLLFTLWPNNNEIILGARWSSGYVLPDIYKGPTLTLLPSSSINSTHIKATFRCQNCTTWEGGSLGNGDLTSDGVVAYVVATTTKPSDPADVASTIQEHDEFDFFGMNLGNAHSNEYSSFIGGSASSSSAPTTTARPTSSSSIPSSTSSAPSAVQTEWGQCGGTGYTGPTACASGLKCVAVSPPYYSQCQAS